MKVSVGSEALAALSLAEGRGNWFGSQLSPDSDSGPVWCIEHTFAQLWV